MMVMMMVTIIIIIIIIMLLFILGSSRKYPYTPHEGSLEIARGERVHKGQVKETSYSQTRSSVPPKKPLMNLLFKS